jgi:hypothetical protein
VVVGNELECVGDALDEIRLFDGRHGLEGTDRSGAA